LPHDPILWDVAKELHLGMLVGTLLLRSTPPSQVTLAAVLSGGGIERITAPFSSSTQ